MSNRLALGDPSYAVEDLGFCHDVYVGLREFAASSLNTSELDDFADALRNSEAYWRNAFALMHIKNPDKSTHTEKEVSVAVLNLALKLILQRPVPEVAQLMRTWIKTGLFGVLDETMEELIRVPGATSKSGASTFTFCKFDFNKDFLSLRRIVDILLYNNQRILFVPIVPCQCS